MFRLRLTSFRNRGFPSARGSEIFKSNEGTGQRVWWRHCGGHQWACRSALHNTKHVICAHWWWFPWGGPPFGKSRGIWLRLEQRVQGELLMGLFRSPQMATVL